jgi:hypothetical protein
VAKLEALVTESLAELRGEAGNAQPEADAQKAEAKRLIKAEQRAGNPLEDAVAAVRDARRDLPREAIDLAGQDVRAESLDDDERVRQAIVEAIPYLGYNPRKVKRFINNFRLLALIANRRGFMNNDAFRADLLARALIIASRWPEIATEIRASPTFVVSFKRAHRARTEVREQLLRRLESNEQGISVQEEEEKIDIYFTNPQVKRFIDASDLVTLLTGMTDADIQALPDYLQLTQTARPSPS